MPTLVKADAVAEHRRSRRVAQDVCAFIVALDTPAFERALDQAFDRDAVDGPQRGIFGKEQGWYRQRRPTAFDIGKQRVADLLVTGSSSSRRPLPNRRMLPAASRYRRS